MQYPDLPKWPGLLVQGSPVSPEQAAEIIIRTHTEYLSTNDHARDQRIRHLLDMKDDSWRTNTDNDRRAAWRFNERRWKQLGHIRLGYLSSHQLCSSWIGGPYGWVDFDGRVFANSFNIGKWPTGEDVSEEWKLIAEAFPFLELRAQLLDREISEDDPLPLIEYSVSNGQVACHTDGLSLFQPPMPEDEQDAMMIRRFAGKGTEHCSPVHFPLIRKTVEMLERKGGTEDH